MKALLALSLLLASFAQAAPAPRKQLNTVERLLEAWQVEDAERALSPLLQSAPDQPRVLRLRAEIAFLKGDYALATTLAREAVRIYMLHGSRKATKAKALRELVEATAAAVKGYVEHRSTGGHFRIFTPRGKDEILSSFAAQTLEAVQKELRQNLGFMPQDPIRVEIYPSPEVLSRVSPLTLEEINRSGTIALCKYNRLMIVTPRAFIRGYSWLDTLAHEYLHLAISRLSNNMVPVWLHEGMAKFFEAVWRLPPNTPPPLAPVQEHLLAEALRKGHFISWEEMHPSMAKLPDQRSTALAFAEVQTAIDFITRLSGVVGLRRMIEAFREGKTEEQAIYASTKMTPKQFDQGWRKYLKAQNIRRLTGLVPLELRFGRQPTAEQRIAAVKEFRAKALLRLASLLRSRGLTLAAIIEYQKARGLLGQRDELVANHLARTYLEISSYAQAIDALLPVLEYYPELPGPQVTIGVAYLRSGDQRAAERHLKAALRINPFDPEIHCNLSKALKAQSPQEAALHGSICRKLN